MRVFVSYSRIDKDAAKRVEAILRKKGIEYFLDERDIEWGADIDASILSAFERITHLIVLVSPASVKSQWVAYEIGLARGRGLKVLPFLLHPSVDRPPFIADLNYKTSTDDIEAYFTTAMGVRSPSTNDDHLRIAVIPKGEKLTFWKLIRAGAICAAKKLGNVEIDWKDQFRETDSTGQNVVIDHCISKRYDGICVAAIHSTETRRSVDKAISSGIPVLIYDSGLEDESNIVSYIATDNYMAGQQAAYKMAELLGNEGNVMAIRYKTGSRSTEERERGFLDTAQSYPKINVVDDGMQISDDDRVIEAVALDVISQYGNQLDAIFCPIEFATHGILDALKGSALAGSIKIVGFDTDPVIVDALRNGQVSAIILQDPIQMGYLAVQIMAKHLLGEQVKSQYKVPCAIGTRENLATPNIKRLLVTRDDEAYL
jgi:ribose transport system substrate-binding protein